MHQKALAVNLRLRMQKFEAGIRRTREHDYPTKPGECMVMSPITRESENMINEQRVYGKKVQSCVKKVFQSAAAISTRT